MKKKIKIFGVIGENLGDEALGISAYRFIENEIGSEFDLSIAEVVAGRASRNTGIKSFFIKRKSLIGRFNILKEIYSADIVVVGGGSLIQDKIGFSILRGTLFYLLQIVILSKLLRKRVISLPIGVDELNTVLGRFYALICIKNINSLFVRDELSKANAIKFGGLNERDVVTVPDPAFLYPEIKMRKEKPKCKYVTVALAKENYDKNLYWDALVALCQELIVNKFCIKLISMDEKSSEDYELNIALKKCLNSKFVELVPLGNRVDTIVNLIRNGDSLITMRLHAAILGYGYVRTIVISRTTKTDALINEYDLKGINIDSPLDSHALIDIYRSLNTNSNYDVKINILKETKKGMAKLVGNIKQG